MKTIEELLKNLSRPEVLEFGLVTNRLPSVNIGGKFEPVDDEAPSNERLMQMLVTMGGARYVDSLSDKPVQWTTKLDGVGVIAVAAILRKDIVQARFTVSKRDAAASAGAARAPAVPASKPAVPPAPPPPPKPAAAAAQSSRSIPAVPPSPSPSQVKPAAPTQATPARPAAPPQSQPMTAVKATAQLSPQVIKGVVAQSTTTRAAPPVSQQGPAAPPVTSPATATVPGGPPPPPQPVPPPPEDEWDDDDEPTLQTLSPPVVPPHMMPPAIPDAPRAKPARRPDETVTQIDDSALKNAKAAAEKVVADKAAAAEKAAAEKAAAEKAAAEKAAAEKAAAEKAAAEKAAAEKAAAEKAAAEKAAAEKAAAEKAAAEKAAAEKAATERAAAEKAAAEKAAQEKAAAERAAAEKAAADRAAAEKAAAEKAAQERATAEKAAAEKAAAEKAAADRAAAEKAAAEKAAAERAAAERAAAARAEAERAAAERAAAERAEAERAEAERAEAERAEAERAEAERAEAERAEAERIEAERIEAEQVESQRLAAEEAAAAAAAAEAARLEEERLAAEQEAERAAAERAAQERATQERVARERAVAQDAARARAATQAQAQAQGKAPAERRISTPTSLDAVDVEITTTHPGSLGVKKVSVDHDVDADGDTVSLPGGLDVARAAQQAATQAEARGPVPTTTAPNIPEKDRPRVEATAAIDAFLAMAVSARASDLIIVGGRPVMLRVATDLLPRTQVVSIEQVERIAKDIVPARLRETLEKEGACDFAVEHLTHGRFRVNVSRQRSGVKLTLRVVAKELPTLASLGLPEAIAGGLRHDSGLVIVTGPTGHGKSTTLAALVDLINRESARHVATIEEPIEHVHPRKKGLVSQRDVGLHTRTKARAFHSALRSDPDVVVVNELRDVDSVRLALTAAEGGRLVLGTMNAPNAVLAAERMLRLFSPTEQIWARMALASTLRLIVGQQLVPSADRTRLHAAVELLPASVSLWAAIRHGRLHELAGGNTKGKGVVHLDASLADLVRAQKVTIEVAKQYAESPVDLEALVAGRKGT